MFCGDDSSARIDSTPSTTLTLLNFFCFFRGAEVVELLFKPPVSVVAFFLPLLSELFFLDLFPLVALFLPSLPEGPMLDCFVAGCFRGRPLFSLIDGASGVVVAVTAALSLTSDMLLDITAGLTICPEGELMLSGAGAIMVSGGQLPTLANAL